MPAARYERLNAALVFLGLAVWYAYTRSYWALAGLHATLPPCPFLLLTGHPCPFCGGTRSFAEVWQGDLGRSLNFNPLGPVYFLGGLGVAAGAVVTAVAGRRVSLSISRTAETRLYLMAGIAVVLSWGVKLLWLGG